MSHITFIHFGVKYWSDGTLVAGQQFGYDFDTIGNRTSTTTGGDDSGANLRTASYANNALNQLTSRTVPGYLDIQGVSIATNTVTVNGTTAYRKWEYYREELAEANSTAPVWQSVSVAATGQSTITGNLFLPETPQAFTYDADGNTLTDGRWTYTWDGENRLVQMTVNPTVGPQYTLNFSYDAKGRRIQKLVSTNGVPVYTNRFLYDGWNLVTELNPTNVLRTYLWGSDLSGSIQGAGGVGGLLAENLTLSGTNQTVFAGYDGNGNVTALVANNGVSQAQYEYGPFGEVLRATGPMAKLNPSRFSTKYQDDESDLLYYGRRYLNTSTGRWLSRDPIEEHGGRNLYGFNYNNLVNKIDKFGLFVGSPIALPAEIAAEIEAGVPLTEIAEDFDVSLEEVEEIAQNLNNPNPKPIPVPVPIPTKILGCVYCSIRHPTWPTCGGPADPVSAITTSAPGFWPGWTIYGTPTETDSGPAAPLVCPSGGTYHTLTTTVFAVIQTGTITYTWNVAVACCNCCYTYSSGHTCRVIHSRRGSGEQPPPPSGPPFQGPR